MRLRDVKRSFGNKTTWEKPFLLHMEKFRRELETVRQYRGLPDATVTCGDAYSLDTDAEAVYIDTPYAKSARAQESNYFTFYHFLDALLDYTNIPTRAIERYAHRPIYEPGASWHPYEDLERAFEALIVHFAKSCLVISYRDDGHPNPASIESYLARHYRQVRTIELAPYKYVLAKKKTRTKELVFVATEPGNNNLGR